MSKALNDYRTVIHSMLVEYKNPLTDIESATDEDKIKEINNFESLKDNDIKLAQDIALNQDNSVSVKQLNDELYILGKRYFGLKF